MNFLDMQSIIGINSEYIDDKTKFIITYISWDANGAHMEQKAEFILTKTAQDDILAGIMKIKAILMK